MAQRGDKSKVYHCDGYYFSGVCPFRGVEDPADVRYRSGLNVPPRFLCNNLGLTKKDKLCSHCVENKEYFPADQKKIRLSAPNGRVVSLTPYQAKDQDFKTKRAFTKPGDLAKYLKEHPELYGVNVTTGDIIGVEVEK